MDPLSVAASVAGLVSLAGQLVPALYHLASTIKEAQQDALAVTEEVASMSIVLQGLQTYIIGRTQASPRRLQLITIEHITASLTACVFTYSELDAILKAMHLDSGFSNWDRATWFMKRESVQNLVTRLQNHKMSFTCMLNILQCDSAGEAEKNMDRLCYQVDLLLKQNKELSNRLRNLEHLSGGGSYRRSMASIARSSLSRGSKRTSEQSTTSRSSHVQSINSNGLQTGSITSAGMHIEPPRVSAFEAQLHRSRVYRHAHANHSESSLVDDGRSTLALSICSSLTLGEVSNISVFALPIFAVELSNAAAYNFTRSSEAAIISTPGQRDLSTVIATPEPNDGQKHLRTNLRVKFQGQLWPAKPSLDSNDEDHVGVFGVPLETSIHYANVAISLIDDEGDIHMQGYIPIVVAMTGATLKENATDAINIFATSGSPLSLSELEFAFDSPSRYGKGFDWTGYSVYDAASLLLRYLVRLPEPVVSWDLYDDFRAPLRRSTPVDTFEPGATILAYRSLLRNMPSLHRQLLLYLLDLLAVFSRESSLNRMTTPKLAAMFQPAILSYPEHSLSPNEERLSQDVLVFLIDNQERFLFGVDGTAVNDEAVLGRRTCRWVSAQVPGGLTLIDELR